MENKILWVPETWKGIKALTMIFLFAPHGKQLTSFQKRSKIFIKTCKNLVPVCSKGRRFPCPTAGMMRTREVIGPSHPRLPCYRNSLREAGYQTLWLCASFPPWRCNSICLLQALVATLLQGYTWTGNWLTSGTGAECPQHNLPSESILPRSFSMKRLFVWSWFFFIHISPCSLQLTM